MKFNLKEVIEKMKRDEKYKEPNQSLLNKIQEVQRVEKRKYFRPTEINYETATKRLFNKEESVIFEDNGSYTVIYCFDDIIRAILNNLKVGYTSSSL